MRILTWNINGIRTLPQYHPWNQLKTCEHILNELKADIVCFQEMKTSRAGLERHVALPGDQYNAFFSFPSSKKGGYSGVGVFTNVETAIPLKAEEGLSGLLNTPSSSSKQPPQSQTLAMVNDASRISPPAGYPRVGDPELVLLPLSSSEDAESPSFVLSKSSAQEEFALLDAEGRCLVMDFGLFVLFNLYCPNSDNGSSRHAYKMNFHNLLGERVRRLMEDEKREVIVVGDINICAAPIDHCEGFMAGNQESFFESPARQWFKNWIDPETGPVVDVLRQCWPERKGMYTCWNTKISARETNYGTRIDYILLSRGLLPWFKHGDIMPSVRGSDHCPVYIDLREEITDANGNVRRLKDEMHMINDEKREAPRLCAKFWPEFSGKQQLLSNFFGRGTKDASLPIVTSTQSSADLAEPAVVDLTTTNGPSESTSTSALEATPHPGVPPPSSILSHSRSGSPTKLPETAAATALASTTKASNAKRKQSHPDSNYPSIPSSSKKAKTVGKEAVGTSSTKAKAKKSQGQMKLSTFFSAGSSQVEGAESAVETGKVGESSRASASNASPANAQNPIDIDALDDNLAQHQLEDLLAPAAPDVDLDPDPELLLTTISQSHGIPSSASPPPPSQSQSQSQSHSPTSTSKNPQHSWSTLFMRVEPPRCFVHDEPTRSWKVNKPGPNRGKEFYLCSRPVGPGYDAGRDKRRREDVDPQYRCNYFKWASEVRSEAIAKAPKK